MEPISLAALGFGAYYLLKNVGSGGGAASPIPNFALSPTVGREIFDTDDKGLAMAGPSLFRFECDFRGEGFFAANPDAYVGIIVRADLGITDNIWGCGMLIGKINAPGANPKAIAVAWDPGQNLYLETASDQLSDGTTYHLALDSAVNATGQRLLRYALSAGGATLRDTGMFPVDAGFDVSKRGLVLARVFGDKGSIYFTNASAKWSRYTG